MPNERRRIPIEELLAPRYEALGAAFSLREGAAIVTGEVGREIGHDDLDYWGRRDLIGKPIRPLDIARAVIIGALREAGTPLQVLTSAIER